MGIKNLKARGMVVAGVSAVVVGALSAFVAVVPHTGLSAQSGPNPGIDGPDTKATRPSASATPSLTPAPILIIPLGGQTGAADGQYASDVPLPPAPHDPGSVSNNGSACPSFAGPNAPKADVASALLDAGATARVYAYKDSAGVQESATITVPTVLMDAIAWQESGWQSAIQACDGGFGTMQIMSGTATWMNDSFKTDFSYQTLEGNTEIGSEYLDWLIAWFGQTYYGGDFDLSNQNLLNDVIAAYNTGPGNVHPTAAGGGIPNPQYVANVEALERLQPWNG